MKNKIIKKVMMIVMDTYKPDNKMMFGLNMIKKALVYPEIFDSHPRASFISLYKEKVGIVGPDN